MRKRTHFEIVSEILAMCKTPKLKTNIMYESNMSYTQTLIYLEELKQKGLLEHSADTYSTTFLGREFLEGLECLLNLWNENELEKDRRLAIDFL